MPIEIKILALGALLLLIHIFVATRFKTAQYGRKWNVGQHLGKIERIMQGRGFRAATSAQRMMRSATSTRLRSSMRSGVTRKWA